MRLVGSVERCIVRGSACEIFNMEVLRYTCDRCKGVSIDCRYLDKRYKIETKLSCSSNNTSTVNR